MTKTNSTKRALLMSALALLMCVSMLIGSTFAWFTDSVISGSNKIQTGTLQIDLELLNKDTGKWTSLKGSNDPIFNYDKWEPGYTDVKILKVENEGTLALKWVAKFVSANDLTELADVIDVYVKPSADEFGYAADRTDLSTWTKKGTVAEFVNTISETTYGNLEANESAYLGIALKMQETAGNKYQGMDLGGAFDIMILATQYTSESDSFNNQYDANAKYDVEIWDGKTVTTPVADADGVYHISTAAELVGMMDVTGNSIYSGKTIVLENNIDLAGRTVKGIGSDSTNFAGVFDGQGYTISNFKIDATNRTFYAGLFNQVSHGGTVRNLTVKDATVVGNSMVGAVASSVDSGAVIDNCKAIDCTVSGVKKVGSVIGYSSGSTVTNNYAENCDVLYSEKEGGEILGFENTGSTVENNTAKDVEVKNADAVFTADALVDAFAGLEAGDVIYLAADVDMTGKSIVPVSGNKGFTMLGNGHTISNLASTQQALFVANSGSSAYTFDGVVLENCSVKSGTNYGALFVGDGDTSDAINITDCHVKNCTVESEKYAAAFVAYTAGWNVVNDGPVYSDVTIADCSVTGGSITGGGSVGAAIAHAGGNVDTINTISNFEVNGVAINGEDADHTGIVVGTANVGETIINNVTYSNVTGNCNSDHVLYGRAVLGTTGSLTIDGEAK